MANDFIKKYQNFSSTHILYFHSRNSNNSKTQFYLQIVKTNEVTGSKLTKCPPHRLYAVSKSLNIEENPQLMQSQSLE